jgi:Tfp pilus assembly protein PilX
MLFHRLIAFLRGQRGVALPMALICLLILSALIVAFSMMAASEPMLANNQLQVAQARAVAESGVERAIWALNNPANASGIPNPLVTAAAPYDGTTATAVLINGAQVGVFTVAVTNGASTNERNIVATGWTPTNTGSGPKVKQKIQVTVYQAHFLDPPSALTVRGEIGVGGNALIDSRSDTSCGNKAGTFSKGVTNVSGSADIYGHDGNNVHNQTVTWNGVGSAPLTDTIQGVPDPTFNQYTYSNDELNALKTLARRNGTYYQGTVSFSASSRIPNGIIYVDTVSGNNIDAGGANTTPTTDFAAVDIHGNAPADASGIFSGMLIVAGSLSISGNFQMHGMVYVLNDFTYMGTGTGQIVGAVMSQNIRDTSATSIDTDTSGNSTIVWNCSYAKTGGGQLPQTFTIESGTYKEISG